MRRLRRVVLVMGREGIELSILLGFSTLAAVNGWVLRSAFQKRDEESLLAEARNGKTVDLWVIGNQQNDVSPELWSGRPIVAVNKDLSASGIPSVVIDEEAAGSEAARHLLQRGHRTFAVFGGAEAWSRRRSAAFQSTVEAAGARFISGGERLFPTWQDPPEMLAHWVQSLPKPIGVLACCDSWGKELSIACRIAGVRVPQDVAIVGVDNDEATCALSWPLLSSVVLPWKRMGYEAALLGERLLNNESPPVEPLVLQPGRVVARQSSDAYGFDDPELIAACSFIQRNLDRDVGVEDILNEVPTSRRSLERKFHRLLGRSIMDHVMAVRIDHAKRLLAETDLPMATVAHRSGISLPRFSMYFKRFSGATPSAFRKQSQSWGDPPPAPHAASTASLPVRGRRSAGKKTFQLG